MRKSITFLLLISICASQLLWAHNYCMSCALEGRPIVKQGGGEMHSCCSRSTESKTKKCTNCGDNCKCSTLDTEDKLNHSLVEFEFSIIVDYISLFAPPFSSVNEPQQIHSQSCAKHYFVDSSPPPLIRTVLSNVILRV